MVKRFKTSNQVYNHFQVITTFSLIMVSSRSPLLNYINDVSYYVKLVPPKSAKLLLIHRETSFLFNVHFSFSSLIDPKKERDDKNINCVRMSASARALTGNMHPKRE